VSQDLRRGLWRSRWQRG